jgi:hypothetical protein
MIDNQKSQIESKLQKLAHKKHLQIVKRCNEAILFALGVAKLQGFTKIYIPASGGWLTYEQFAKKVGLGVITVPTFDEQLDVDFLRDNLDAQSILLCHTLAGYHAILPTPTLREICDATKALYIEDICGSIGKILPLGDVVVCSFGNAKPLSVGMGGFIASDNILYTQNNTEFVASSDFLEKLDLAITQLPNVLNYFYTKRNEIETKFNLEFETEIRAGWIRIISSQYAIVLIAEYAQTPQYEQEKIAQKIISFCELLGIEHTLCPRYIRHDKLAISVEIKRLTQ